MLTCDRWEVYPHQQGEEAADVSQDVAAGAGGGTVRIHIWHKAALFQHNPFF